MSAQAFLEDMEAIKSKKVEAIGWAEDDCDGMKIVRVRMVYTNLTVKTRLLDLKPSASKYAVHKMEAAKASVLQAMNNDQAVAKLFCSKVKASACACPSISVSWSSSY